ncbi:alpha-ketoglutarate-dependent dioxygenase AlkB [Nonomuraea sp. C10]|nr:alpha-ketoglutarate-dependent dioxygenase AlkB [Nonomuraea sp. C10]
MSTVTARLPRGRPGRLRAWIRRRRTTWRITLEHGSLLLMTQTTQRTWTHGVPRTTSAGRRIGLTFRCFDTGSVR